MNGTVYAIILPATAVTTAIDLLEIQPADDRPVRIVGMEIFQTSDVGDAAEEILPIQIIRGFTASGSSGGSAPTPRDLRRVGATAGFVVEVMNTTVATTGTSHTLLDGGWNVRTPYTFWPDEMMCPQASQADVTLIVRLPSAPADSLTIRGTVYVLEEA